MAISKRIGICMVIAVMVICLALCAAVLQPAETASAEGIGDVIAAQKDEYARLHHEHEGWKAISAAGSISASGSYYLTAEITVTVHDNGLSGGAIAGIAVGSTAGAACIGAAVWYFAVRRKKSSL